jgi:hypothetical protein
MSLIPTSEEYELPEEKDFRWLAEEGWLSVIEISELFGVSRSRANAMIVDDGEFDPEDVRRSKGGKLMVFVRASAAMDKKASFDRLATMWDQMDTDERAQYRKDVRAWVESRLGDVILTGELPRRLLVAYMKAQEQRKAPRVRKVTPPAKKAASRSRRGSSAQN